jgi:hypothetical protein
MRLLITVELDNDDFLDHHHGGVLDRRRVYLVAVEAAAKMAGSSEDDGKVSDANGNTVGEWRVTEDWSVQRCRWSS